MKELREIVRAWSDLKRGGREAVLATVLRTRGSTYRKAGARMLMTEDTWIAGAISGGCLEGDLLRKAWWRTAERDRVLITYDGNREDEIGPGVGCDGSIDVLLERLRPEMPFDPVAVVRAAMVERRPCAISTVIGDLRRAYLVDGMVIATDLPPDLADAVGNAARSGASTSQHGPYAVVHERLDPPMPLFLFGSNHDAIPVLKLARELGWEVTQVEKRPSAVTRPSHADRVLVGRAPAVFGDLAIDEDAAVVVMTHNLDEDREVLRAALRTRARYVGILGPRRRTERLLDEIDADVDARARLHGPIGLDLGGRSPEEIALSIVAQIQAARHDRL